MKTFAQPPTTAQTIWIIGRLAVRRQVNQWQRVGFGWRKARGGAGERSGTPTKAGRRSIFGAALFLLMLFSGFAISINGVARIQSVVSASPRSPGRFAVSAFTYAHLLEINRDLKELKTMPDAQRKKFEGMWSRYLDRLLAAEVRWGTYSESEEQTRVRQMRAAFYRTGPSGFLTADNSLFALSKIAPRLSEQERSVYLGALSLLFALWVPTIVFLDLGGTNKDLAEVEWTLEWLYTFPVPARALFLSKLLVYSFLNQLIWWLLFPFAALVFYAAGYRFAALPLGIAVTAYLALPAGCVSMISELALRRYLSLDRLRNIQALFTVLGTVCLLIFYTCMFSAPAIARLAHTSASIPELASWNPLSLPLIAADRGLGAWQRELCLLAIIALCLAAIFLTLRAAEWLTQEGLIKASGPYQGSRQAVRAGIGSGWLRGIAAQQLLLLRRDRNLLVQVFAVPLLMPAYYLLLDPHLRSALTGNFRRAAMVTFLLGAYSFIYSVLPVLSREAHTLWLLFSFPRKLVSLLLDKVAFWAVAAVIYSAAVLELLIHFSPHLEVTSWGYAILAFYGIVLYAFIAAGLGFLSADVLQAEPQARMKIGTIYLYLLLTAVYANIFFSASLWTGLADLVLSTLLAVALWQKVETIAPYLLDPTQRPPRTLSLADGLIAALAFSVTQIMAAFFLQNTSLALTIQVTLAYVIAALTVGIAALVILWLQGLPDLWKEIGLAFGDTIGSRMPAARAVAEGAFWGAAAALGAFAYLHVLDCFPQWHVWKQDAELTSFLAPSVQPLWIYALIIIAAPLLEEFVFRGLIFQGLRRMSGPALAILGSAALFALVHPPIAVIPVFGLGIAAAVSFERSGFLLAPILAHAVYNGCVLLLNRV